MPSHFDTAAENEKLAGFRKSEEEDLTRILSEKYALEYTDLTIVPINGDALRLLPEEAAKKAEAVVFDKAGTHLSIAVRNPQSEALEETLQELSEKGFTATLFLVSEQSLQHAYERYAEFSHANMSTAGSFSIAAPELAELTERLTSIAALRAELTARLLEKKAVSVSSLFEVILAAASALRASDIHFEPEEVSVRLRLRIDGLLTDAFDFNEKQYHLLNSRIKLLSGLKLNVEKRAQDGRFSISLGGPEVEVRTSVIPGAYGESIVLRILDPKTTERTFEDMGINEKLLARLRVEIARPNGMLLATGPTGSGKTTTLYTFLRAIHTPDVKIITIEDPIEYHVPGIVQTQTNGEDYTFALGLRSILRQDPDVILVGEIRDAEVATTAVQAALTGHFVFSTLHTNNAAGTFPRLVDLGVDPKLFASAVSVSMAQRLVRTLDDATKKARPTTDAEKAMMQRVFAELTDTTLVPTSYDTVYEAVSDDLGNTGYRGRMGVHEAIFMDADLGEFLRNNPSEGEIAEHVKRQGFPTMAQDGLLKVLQGKTTLEELSRVVDLPHE